MSSKAKVIVGVDPAFRKSGFALAIIDFHDNTIAFKTFVDPLDFLGWLYHESPENAVVSIENSFKQNTVFSKYITPIVKNGLPLTRKLNEAAAKGMYVGMNRCYSQVAYRLFVEHYGENKVYNISPQQKGKKWEGNLGLKLLQAMCLKYKLKMLKARPNNDEKDAAKMAFIALERPPAKRFKSLK